jgi:hypothetical protein
MATICQRLSRSSRCGSSAERRKCETDADREIVEQNKLEAQYVVKRESALNEVSDLKQQLDLKNQENRSLSVTVESLKGANEELKVSWL